MSLPPIPGEQPKVVILNNWSVKKTTVTTHVAGFDPEGNVVVTDALVDFDPASGHGFTEKGDEYVLSGESKQTVFTNYAWICYKENFGLA